MESGTQALMLPAMCAVTMNLQAGFDTYRFLSRHNDYWMLGVFRILVLVEPSVRRVVYTI
jgi:hypothetical protein